METYNKIVNPRTKRAIYQYDPVYDELISKYKYTEEYLNSLPKITATKIPKSPKIKSKQQVSKTIVNKDLPSEIIQEILLKSDINTIKSYCSNKKYQEICNNDQFWKAIFKRDNLPILDEPRNVKQWIHMYLKTVYVIKELDIIFLIIKDKKIDHLRVTNKDKNFDKHLNIKILQENGVFYIHFNEKDLYITD